jgi:hypothetical protein
MNTEIESWKDIPSLEGHYQASDFGNIRSFIKNKITLLSQYVSKKKYCYVVIYMDKKPKTTTVHQLVAMAFYGHVPCGMELVVEHKNQIRNDNRLVNLEIITQRKNTDKKHLTSTSKYVGVCWKKNSKKWISSIWYNRKKIFLGRFDSELEASEYYQNALKAIENGTEIVVKKANFSSMYKGVSWHSKINKWQSRIYINKSIKHLGYYQTELEAYLVVEKYKKENNII